MTRIFFILRTLFHYWQTNLSVLAGVAVGTAVISGALIVGDSVRYSLRQMTLDRLADIDYALSGSRFFREELAEELEKNYTKTSGNSRKAKREVAPAILLTGTLRFQKTGQPSKNNTASEDVAIAGRVNLIGCDERLWSHLRGDLESLPDQNQIVLNERVADQLQVKPGDKITLFVDVPSTIPQESLLGERDIDELTVEIPLTVSHIVASKTTLGRFSLQPNQKLPLNAYLNLDRLQNELQLSEQPASRRNRFAKPARVNALLISDPTYSDTSHQSAEELLERPNRVLQKLLNLEDFHLRIIESSERGYFSLESERMILERGISRLAEESAKKTEQTASPALVYLVNEISNADNPKKYSMYSVAVGVDFQTVAPFGPFQNAEGDTVDTPKDGTVVINDWIAKDLDVTQGDEIVIKYHVVGSRGDLPEIEKKFRVAEIVTMEGTPAADAGLTPFVEGITDAKTLTDWEQPFPMEMSRITARDELYWLKYKATPKLFMSLKEAQSLWESRYGNTTSVRVGLQAGEAMQQQIEIFRKQFLHDLPARQLGLTIQPVKFQGLQAARGTMDFTGLFIGFSFFVIAAAAVLIALLFRLGIETRVQQIGLLSAVGFSARSVQIILLTEGSLVAVAGIAGGLFLALFYGSLMIYGLKTWWVGAIGTTFLEVDVQWVSLLSGAVISLCVAIPGMFLGVRALLKISPRDRLAGVTFAPNKVSRQRETNRWQSVTGTLLLAVAVLVMLAASLKIVPRGEAFGGFNWQIVGFFVAGICSLAGSLMLYSVILQFVRPGEFHRGGLAACSMLGIRNTTRNRQRSGVTVTLVAFATFVVVAVAAGRKNPSQTLPDFNSGNGGFSLVAESARPLLYDMTSQQGQDKLGLNASGDESVRKLMSQLRVIPFRVRPGEDASCLNLYQTRLPTILGVPEQMIQRGGFLFADTPGENPWELLRGKTETGNIPVMGDMDSLQYSMHKAIGDPVELPEELHREETLQVVGSLGGSVFQGVLLMSEENFLELFPDIAGSNYFLIECNPELNEEVARTLETRLISFGFDVEPIGKRLENFLAVQNTYLSTFQALGGFGLLLGTFGLGTVMLRNVLERKSELALMRAIGFRHLMVAVIVLAENAWLLLLGLLIGTTCALIAMVPQITSRGSEVPWISGGVLILSVFVVGMLSSLLAVFEAVRVPILQTLRDDH